MPVAKSNLVKVNAAAVRAHLRTFSDVDPEGDVEPRRLTLDPTRDWYRVVCPDGHVHHVTPSRPVDKKGDVVKGSRPKLGPITFECDVDEPGKHAPNTKYTITPAGKA